MTTRTERRLAKKRAAKYPDRLQEVPREQWPASKNPPVAIWVSRDYLVQEYPGQDAARLSICSTTPTSNSWADGLTWDELMEIKRQCGFADWVAVEIYPDDANIVNVSNMRHLWLIPEAPSFMWRAS